MKIEELHGDPGHSCYNEDGELSCVIAKFILFNGPGWRELIGDKR